MCIMKTVTVILVIFYACLHAADNLNIKPPNILENIKPSNILEDAMSGIGGTINNVTHTIIPECVFGVENVSMVLYTRDIPLGKIIWPNETYNNFDPSKPIVFLVHGFISTANYSYNYGLAKALVKKDVTVFSLDWSKGACTTGIPIVRLTGYPFAVKNTREIGELMASYIMSLIDKYDVPLNNITLIGHSLGAHVCGFASKKLQTLNIRVTRIIGVDPAKPFFSTNKCANRLCETDAEIVIAFHTSPLGIWYRLADIDLYFDDGLSQPQCYLDVACSHSRGSLYITKVVDNNCIFPSVPKSIQGMIPLPLRKPSYPNSNTTDCFIMDGGMIFDKKNILRYFKGKSYYVFVEPNTFCTKNIFNCQSDSNSN